MGRLDKISKFILVLIFFFFSFVEVSRAAFTDRFIIMNPVSMPVPVNIVAPLPLSVTASVTAVVSGIEVTFPDSLAVTQSGTWTTGRTWNLDSLIDSATVYQGGGPWTFLSSGVTTVSGNLGRTWNLSAVSDSVSVSGITNVLSSLATINTSVVSNTTILSPLISSINTSVVSGNLILNAINSALGTVNTNLGTINTSLGTINTSIGTNTTAATSGSNGIIAAVNTNTTATTSGFNGVITAVSTNTTQTVSGQNTIIGWLTSIWTRMADGLQKTQIVDSQGKIAGVTPYNRLQVTVEGSTRMVDKFDGTSGLDTNMWTVTNSGGGSVSATTGSLVFTLGTATNNGARIDSVPRFQHPGNAFLQFGMSLTFESGGLATNTRGVIGFAQGGGSYTNPATDGVYYEIDGVSFSAVVMRNNVKIFSQDITSFLPTDGSNNRYDIVYNTQNLTFRINGVNVAQTTGGFNPATQTLPARIYRQNSNTTSPNKTPVLQSQAFAITDTAHNNYLLSDATYPWRMASVTASGSQVVSDILEGDLQAGAKTIGPTQTLAAVSTANMVGRKSLLIYNSSGVVIYYGGSGVTTATGIPIRPLARAEFSLSDRVNVYLISSSSETVRVSEGR